MLRLALVLALALTACAGETASEDPSATPGRAAFTCDWQGTDVASEPDWRQYGSYREWKTLDGCLVRIDVISDINGPEHCGFQEARVISVGVPIGARITDSTNDATYVRDPDDVFGDPATAGALDLDAELPTGAVDTGLRQGLDQLWIDPADASAIFLLTEGAVERWPLDPEPAGCT